MGHIVPHGGDRNVTTAHRLVDDRLAARPGRVDSVDGLRIRDRRRRHRVREDRGRDVGVRDQRLGEVRAGDDRRGHRRVGEPDGSPSRRKVQLGPWATPTRSAGASSGDAAPLTRQVPPRRADTVQPGLDHRPRPVDTDPQVGVGAAALDGDRTGRQVDAVAVGDLHEGLGVGQIPCRATGPTRRPACSRPTRAPRLARGPTPGSVLEARNSRRGPRCRPGAAAARGTAAARASTPRGRGPADGAACGRPPGPAPDPTDPQQPHSTLLNDPTEMTVARRHRRAIPPVGRPAKTSSASVGPR